MDERSKKTGWLERVEDLINVLEGSTIGELELTEGGTEIIIRRQPGMVMTAVAGQASTVVAGEQAAAPGRPARADQSLPVITPLTGVYYAAASPTSPPFVAIGDMVSVGQVVALVEAMKVFNEVTADVTGRVVKLVATSGEVVQKGDVLLRVEPV